MNELVTMIKDHCAATGTPRAKILRDANITRGAYQRWEKGGGVSFQNHWAIKNAIEDDLARVRAALAAREVV